MQISYFPSLYAKPRNKDVDEVVSIIGGTELAETTENLRDLSVDKYLNTRGRKLPSVTWSGTFQHPRSVKNFISHTGLICLDYDKLNDVDDFATILKGSEHTNVVFVSPSAVGVKVIVPVEPLPTTADEHKIAYARVESYFNYFTETTAEADKSCKDVSRLCYLCYDPEIYYEPSATPILWSTYPDLASALDAIPADDYDVWINIGIALYNMGPQEKHLLQLWDAWSKRAPNYKKGVCKAKWETFEARDDGPKQDTIFYTARSHGWVPSDDVSTIPDDMRPDGDTLLLILPQMGLRIRRNLRNSEIEITTDDLEWLGRFSTMVIPVDRWVPIDDYIVADLISSIQKKYNTAKGKPLRYNKNNFSDALTRVAALYPVDTFSNWLAGLPAWDNSPRVARIFTLIGCEANILNAEAAKRTLVGAIKRTYEPGTVHDWLPVIVGPQGCGKSSLIRALLPEGYNFISDSPTLDGTPKEQIEAIGSAALVEYAELGGVGPKDVNRVKAYLSKTHDRVRLAYRRSPETVARRWVGIGSANDDSTGVLPPDHTGSRRYVVVPVRELIDSKDMRTYLDEHREQVWAEAKHLYRAGYDNTLSPALVRKASNINQDYIPGNEYLVDQLMMLHEADRIENFPIDEILTEAELIFDKTSVHAATIMRQSAKILTGIGYQRKRRMIEGVQRWRWYYKQGAGLTEGDGTGSLLDDE